MLLGTESHKRFPRFRHVRRQLRIWSAPSGQHEAIALGRLLPLAEPFIISGGTMTVRRSLVVGDSVLTVSENGVKESSLATLAERGWAAFPAPK